MCPWKPEEGIGSSELVLKVILDHLTWGFFLCGHVVFPALLVEDAVFSPMYAFGIFVKY